MSSPPSTSVSEAPKNKLWFVYLPDYTDPDAPARRAKARAAHRAGADVNIASRWTRVAGPMFEPKLFDEGGERKFLGTVFIVEAPSYQEVKAKMEDDPYWKGDVWDKERMLITGFASATSYPANP